MRITGNIMMFLVFLALGMSISNADDECVSCIPTSVVHNVQLFSPCSYASSGEYCVDSIIKTTEHIILWPDGTFPERYYLTAFGRSACAATCTKDWIGAPWYHTQCWPQFFSPVRGSHYYYAAAADLTTDVIMNWCSTMAYVWAVFCTGTGGPLHYIFVDHLCQGCGEDKDQDGFVAMEAGGDDCCDTLPNIHPGAPPICQQYYDANCDGVPDLNEPLCFHTPIVIDLGKDGIALTSKAEGVAFDLDNDGTREKLSWTSADSDDAWLCLDRNGNGTIDNGTELFGSATPQPEPPEGSMPNGFLALAVFDSVQKGGNGNGVIDSGDPIYNDLLLWQDFNHDGTSEPNELKPLKSCGVAEISLDYKLSRKVDEFGNQYRYRAKIAPQKKGNSLGKWAWDVILTR
jgi:hypothetical protein